MPAELIVRPFPWSLCVSNASAAGLLQILPTQTINMFWNMLLSL